MATRPPQRAGPLRCPTGHRSHCGPRPTRVSPTHSPPDLPPAGELSAVCLQGEGQRPPFSCREKVLHQTRSPWGRKRGNVKKSNQTKNCTKAQGLPREPPGDRTEGVFLGLPDGVRVVASSAPQPEHRAKGGKPTFGGGGGLEIEPVCGLRQVQSHARV